MKFFILFLLSLLAADLPGQDKKATRILDKLYDAYSASSSITIDFDLTIQFPEEEATTLPSQVVQSGNKFVFSNSEHAYYGNGNDIWVYIAAQNEVQINDFEEEESEDYFITPLDLLKQYGNGQYEYEIREDRKSELDIEFKPIDEFSDYAKFRITVNPSKNEVSKIVAFGKDGTKISIDMGKLSRNISYPDSYFEFDAKKYPGVRIEDLRLD